MRKTLFAIILSMAFLLSLAVLPVAGATTSQSNPEFDIILPSGSDYVELEEPIATVVSNKYLSVIYTHSEQPDLTQPKIYTYYLTCNENGHKVADFSLGKVEPRALAVYNDYAFVTFKDDSTLYIYDITTGQTIDINRMPSVADDFCIDGHYLYVRDRYLLGVVDLTTISNNTVERATQHAPINFEALTFTVLNGVVYYEDTVTRNSTQTIYKYDIATKVTEELYKGITDSFNRIVTNGEYVFTMNTSLPTNEITAYSITDTTLTPSKPTIDTENPSAFFVNGNEFYFTSRSVGAIDVYEINGDQLTLTRSISSNGSIPGRFNTPSSVYNHADGIIVTDTMNERVQIFNPDLSVKSIVSGIKYPFDAVGNLSFGYIATADHKIYTYVDSSAPSEYVHTKTVDGVNFFSPEGLVMDADQTVYALDGRSASRRVIYKTKEATAFSTFDIPAPKALSISPKGSVIYAIYEDKITAYDKNAKEIFSIALSSIPVNPLSSVVDADTDVDGNLYILKGTELVILDRTWSGYTHRETITLEINSEIKYFASVAVDANGEILLTGGSDHCVFKLKNVSAGVYDPNDYIVPDFTGKAPITQSVQFVKVKAGGGFVYDYKANYESARVVDENTLLLLLSNDEVDNMYFVYYNGKAGYLPSAYVEEKNEATLNKYAGIALYNTTLYKYPIAKDEFALIQINKDTKFNVESDAYGYEFKDGDDSVFWYQIEYEGSIYYVNRENVAEVEVEIEKDYGKAKLLASVMNASVKMYSFPDKTSSIIGEYADGTEVTLLEEINSEKEFTKVSIDGNDGYVLTTELTTGGMTTGQIILLIIIILGGAASAVILVLSRRNYKKK